MFHYVRYVLTFAVRSQISRRKGSIEQPVRSENQSPLNHYPTNKRVTRTPTYWLQTKKPLLSHVVHSSSINSSAGIYGVRYGSMENVDSSWLEGELRIELPLLYISVVELVYVRSHGNSPKTHIPRA